ncbi:hypothetical protein [Enterobacter sp. 22452]|uniref:hypothetical protein n=1 Tax=Enterobacter TaxID=547 RepID=UPI003F83890C
MLKKLLISLSLLSSCSLSPAQASWKTTTEQDIFSPGYIKAELVGDITNHNQSVIFNCSKDSLSVSQVELDPDSMIGGEPHYQTLIEVPDNNPVVFNTVLSRRNAKYIQMMSNETTKIKLLLKQFRDESSRKDFLIGNIDSNGNHVSSGSGSVSFAKKAVKEFIAACNITL